jgi:hypothetical protein|nr:MAG TPA: hypothetical protein [Caudoviricetes sp.]
MSDKEIKIQAYRDFANRLKARKRAVKGYDFNGEFWDYAVLAEDIENTLIEMASEIE